MDKQTAIVALNENGNIFESQIYGVHHSQLSKDQAIDVLKKCISRSYRLCEATITLGKEVNR